MFIIFILLILLIIIIIALIAALLTTNPKIIRVPAARAINSQEKIATTVEGNSDGSWFEVKDQDGDVILGIGSRDVKDVEITCPEGVALIGVGENSLGPIICNDQDDQQELDALDESAKLYGFMGECPAGYHKDSLGVSHRFICVPDVECAFQVDCAPGFTCNNDKCEPIEDF